MKLLTKALESRFEQVGKQEHVKDPLVIVKFFNPYGSGTWYATEFDPENRIFFGYVTGLGCEEWGSFSLDELSSVRITPYQLPLERDKYFEEQPISKILKP